MAGFALMALESAAATGRALPLGGPETLSPLQVVRIFEEVMGRSLAVRFVPAWLPRAVNVVLRPFSPRIACIAALVAAGSRGDVIPMRETLQAFPATLTSMRDVAIRMAPARG